MPYVYGPGGYSSAKRFYVGNDQTPINYAEGAPAAPNLTAAGAANLQRHKMRLRLRDAAAAAKAAENTINRQGWEDHLARAAELNAPPTGDLPAGVWTSARRYY